MLRAGHSEASVPLRSLPGVSSAQSWPVLALGHLAWGGGRGSKKEQKEVRVGKEAWGQGAGLQKPG